MGIYSKAIVALIMALIGIANTFFGIDIGLNETLVTVIVSALTPVLVYLVPNKR